MIRFLTDQTEMKNAVTERVVRRTFHREFPQFPNIGTNAERDE